MNTNKHPATLPEGRACAISEGAHAALASVQTDPLPTRLRGGAYVVGKAWLAHEIERAYLQGRADEAATREVAK